MIRKINRADLLTTYSSVREEILQMQSEQYDPDQLNFLDSEAAKADYLEMFDARGYPRNTVTKYYKVLSIHHLDVLTYPKALAAKVVSLLSGLHIESLVVLSPLKVNLFGNVQNDYPPLKNAYRKLLSITAETDFKKAFRISLGDLPIAIEIFFWTARCDSTAPEYIVFFDTKNQLGFFVCQYGNLHTIEFGKEILTKRLLQSLAFEEVKHRCYDKFTPDGKIAGRK